jgi:endonuclease-3
MTVPMPITEIGKAEKERIRLARQIYRALTKRYPNVHCELEFQSPFQLLVAVVLSAQCTDKKVNQVTPALFNKYKNPKAMAGADFTDIEDLIRPTGFFRVKAKHLKVLSEMIITNFGGKVPETLEELVTLPGVGRKTANVVLGHAFAIPGITVDTHFGRLSRRFGWTTELDPVKVEIEVGKLIPRKEWTNLSQRMIWHGRRICHSRKPACGACPLSTLCPSYGIGEVDPVKALALVKSDEAFR